MALGRWKILIAAAAVVVIGVAVLTVNHYRPLTVELRQPEADVAIKVFGLGTVEVRVVSKIGFKVAGTLTDLRVDHGDRVAAGQVLAQIDPSEQKARLAKARAQVLSAEAAVKVAEAASRKSMALVTQRSQVNQRRQSLLARQAVSVEAAEDAQLNEGVARADQLVALSEIESAKARLDDAKAQYDFDSVVLSQHELRAPIRGPRRHPRQRARRRDGGRRGAVHAGRGRMGRSVSMAGIVNRQILLKSRPEGAALRRSHLALTALKSVRVVDIALGDGITKRSVTHGTQRAAAVLRALAVTQLDPPTPPQRGETVM